MMPKEADSVERRYIRATDFEVRADDEGGAFVAIGHAATFDEPYPVFDFREVVAPGAFDGSLKDPDVMALWNHNSDNPLGRTGAGTLKLSTDKRGLVSEIHFPESAQREREAVERGDVSKMSFGFRTIKDQWETDEDGNETRTLLEVELFDVSPVSFPANPKTDLSVAQRSREEWRAQQDQHDEDVSVRHNLRRKRLDMMDAEQ